MSFRQFYLEIREMREILGATVRRRLKRERTPRRQRLHTLCAHLDVGSLHYSPIDHVRMVALDTETTGFDPYAGDEIVEICLVEYIGLRRTGREFCSLVKPAIPIPADSTDVHGISDADVIDAPAIDDILDDIVEFIGDAVIVGHHVDFDLRFLNRVMRRNLDCDLPQPVVDTMILFMALRQQLNDASLDEVAEACGVAIAERHRARGDAIACGDICVHLIRNLLQPDAQVADILAIGRPIPEYGPGYLEELERLTRTDPPGGKR